MEKNPWPLISGAVICWSNCEFMSTSASCLLCFYATFSATLSLPQKDSASPIWFVPVPFSLLLILLLFMVSFLCIARDIRGNVPICLLCFLVRYLPVCYLNLSISLLFYLCIYIYIPLNFIFTCEEFIWNWELGAWIFEKNLWLSQWSLSCTEKIKKILNTLWLFLWPIWEQKSTPQWIWERTINPIVYFVKRVVPGVAKNTVLCSVLCFCCRLKRNFNHFTSCLSIIYWYFPH